MLCHTETHKSIRMPTARSDKSYNVSMPWWYEGNLNKCWTSVHDSQHRHSQWNHESFIDMADDVAMAPVIDGLSIQIFEVWKESNLPSSVACSILTDHWLRTSVSSVCLCVFARTNEGHCENVCIHHISRGEQNHETKSGSELRPLECGLHC